MDYSKLSDSALEQIASGKPVDYSKLDDADLEHIAGGAPAPEAKEPFFKAGPLTIEKNPLDVDWLGAAANEVTKPLPPGAMTVGDNPVLNYAVPGGAPEAAVSGISKGLSAMGRFMKGTKAAKAAVPEVLDSGLASSGGLLKAAPVTTPPPVAPPAPKPFLDRFADATNVSKFGGGGLVGRAGAYGLPGPLKYVQAASDTARAAGKAQSVIGEILEKSPEVLGKFAPVLQKAAQAGGGGLAMTHYLLSQKDPEYQKIMKEQSGQ